MEVVCVYLILPLEEIGKEERTSGGPLKPDNVVLRAKLVATVQIIKTHI